MPLIVCHIGWMQRYRGLANTNDTINGGGAWVQNNGNGGEVCNFLPCNDGNIYGHVETIHGETDCQIIIENLGASMGDNSVAGVNVIWTARKPVTGGRYVIGWYRDAEVFRQRQHFRTMPSEQHQRDDIGNFRVRAKANNATLLPEGCRTLQLGRGRGWIGQRNWWFPENRENEDVKTFIKAVRALMNGRQTREKVKDAETADGAIPLPDPRQFSTGPELEAHKRLKTWVAARPCLFKEFGTFRRGETEQRLASGDRLDVFFSNGANQLAVEIKSREVPEAEVQRGLYQCVKYQATLRAMQLAKARKQNAQAVLVINRQLSDAEMRLAKRLSVETKVVDGPGK